MSFSHDPLSNFHIATDDLGETFELECGSCGWTEEIDTTHLVRSVYNLWLIHLSSSHKIEKPKPRCNFRQEVEVEGNNRKVVGILTCTREKHSDESHEILWTSKRL